MPTNEERHEVARKLRMVNIAEGASQVEETEGLDMAAAARFVAIPNLGSTIGGMKPIFSFNDLQNRLADLIEPESERTCEWSQDKFGNWHTSCGRIFVLTNCESLEDNNIVYCHNCGGVIEVVEK